MRAQAFIARKLDRSSASSYQIIILEIFFHGRTEGRTEERTEGQDTPKLLRAVPVTFLKNYLLDIL